MGGYDDDGGGDDDDDIDLLDESFRIGTRRRVFDMYRDEEEEGEGEREGERGGEVWVGGGGRELFVGGGGGGGEFVTHEWLARHQPSSQVTTCIYLMPEARWRLPAPEPAPTPSNDRGNRF